MASNNRKTTEPQQVEGRSETHFLEIIVTIIIQKQERRRQGFKVSLQLYIVKLKNIKNRGQILFVPVQTCQNDMF